MVYKLVSWAAQEAGIGHRYSSEYCLAMALTEHYDALAQAFPVFARLRELSKALAVVRLMGIYAVDAKEARLLGYLFGMLFLSINNGVATGERPETMTPHDMGVGEGLGGRRLKLNYGKGLRIG